MKDISMDIIKLIGVFYVILLLIRLKKPLYAAMLSGVAAVSSFMVSSFQRFLFFSGEVQQVQPL